MKKVGELITDSTTLVIYKDEEARCNPYRIYRKWFDEGWHKKLVVKFQDLLSCTYFINDYVRENG